MIPLDEIQAAAEAIQDRIIRTPLVFSTVLSEMFGGRVYLKLENLQKTGSFKIRGATYKLLRHRSRIKPVGVVAASAGNHAQGVALAARQAGISATIVMPVWASISKKSATASYGGRVLIEGRSVAESLQKAQALAAEGRFFIHPFDDLDIMTGQGTVGLEIMQDLPDVDMILVPVGGGGLIAGIASAAKQLRPDTTVVGVQARACPSAFDALRRGRLTAVAASASLADGISVKQIGAAAFPLIQAAVDRIVLAGESQIAAAVLLLLERKKVLAEGAGAVPVAALLNGSVAVSESQKVVLVISGGNMDSSLLGRVIRQGLLKTGRLMRIRVRLADRPGVLSSLLDRISRKQANVLHIYHDRYVKDTPVNTTYVELEMETRGPEHIAELAEDLQKTGYAPELK